MRVTGQGWWVECYVYLASQALDQGWWVECYVYLASQALACAGDGCFLPLCAYAMLRRYSRSGPVFSLRMRFFSSRLHSAKFIQNMLNWCKCEVFRFFRMKFYFEGKISLCVVQEHTYLAILTVRLLFFSYLPL